MTDVLGPYGIAIASLGFAAVLMFIQLVVADVVGIKTGQAPGYPIEANYGAFLFRANRAFSNTNESVSIFVLALAFAVLQTANPFWVNTGALVYLIGRLAHTICYYLNHSLLRSVSFGVAMIGILAILIAGFVGFFN